MWATLTWPEIEERLKIVDTAILPCGAIEQHGPHLPLDVDVVCPTSIGLGAGQQGIPQEYGGIRVPFLFKDRGERFRVSVYIRYNKYLHPWPFRERQHPDARSGIPNNGRSQTGPCTALYGIKP